MRILEKVIAFQGKRSGLFPTNLLQVPFAPTRKSEKFLSQPRPERRQSLKRAVLPASSKGGVREPAVHKLQSPSPLLQGLPGVQSRAPRGRSLNIPFLQCRGGCKPPPRPVSLGKGPRGLRGGAQPGRRFSRHCAQRGPGLQERDQTGSPASGGGLFSGQYPKRQTPCKGPRGSSP